MFRVIDLRVKPWPLMFAYVGREWAGLPASPVGNPFRGPRAVEEFRGWLSRHPQRERLLWELLGDTEAGRFPLACWCGFWSPGQKPLACHAVVIAEALAERFGISIVGMEARPKPSAETIKLQQTIGFA